MSCVKEAANAFPISTLIHFHSASERPSNVLLIVERRFGGSTAAARSSAAAAGEKMRETMAGSLAAMKNLNLGFSRMARE